MKRDCVLYPVIFENMLQRNAGGYRLSLGFIQITHIEIENPVISDQLPNALIADCNT